MKNNPKREVYNNTGLAQDAKNTSNKQSNLTPKGTRKRTIKPKVVDEKK